MQNQADPFPLDFESIRKGDVIDAGRIANILGIQPSDPHYALKLLGLKQQAERELMALGRPATIVCDHSALRVLTDVEAIAYNTRAFERDRRRMARSHVRLMQVDRAQLDDDQVADLEQAIDVQGRQLLALRRARNESLIEPEPDHAPAAIT